MPVPRMITKLTTQFIQAATVCEQRADLASKPDGLQALADLILEGELNDQQDVQKQNQEAPDPKTTDTKKLQSFATNGAEKVKSVEKTGVKKTKPGEISDAETRPKSKPICSVQMPRRNADRYD